MSLPELSYEKVWTSAEDFPTYEGSEEQVRLDYQYHPDAVKDYINERLIPALQGVGEDVGASCIGMFPVEALGGATNVQAAMEALIDLVNAVTQGAVPDGSITAQKLAEAAVTAAKIALAAVTADKIAAGAVTTEKLADGLLTEGKFGEKCVPGSALQDGLISAGKIASGAVTSAKIGASAVTSAKIASDAVTADKIVTGAVTADKLAPEVTVSAMMSQGYLQLSEYQYGDELPTPGIPGRIFFKRVT